jgi:hypothetical protein
MSKADQLNFDPQIEGQIPHYIYEQLVPENVASGSVPIAVSSQNPVSFRVSGGSVVNLAQSYRNARVSLPAGGAGLFGVALLNVPLEASCIVQMGNSQPVKIDYLQHYHNALAPLKKTRDELLQRSQTDHLFACNTPANQNITPFSADCTAAGAVPVGLASASSVNYSEKQWVLVSSAANTALELNLHTKLKDLVPDSLLDQDYDFVCGSDLQIKFGMAPAVNMFWYTSSPATPWLNVTQVAVGLTATQYSLYIARQTNKALVEKVVSKMESGGIRYKIPFGVINSFAGALNAVNNLTLSIDSSNGLDLKRVLLLPYSSRSDNSAYTFDHSNIAASKIKSYNISLGSSGKIYDQPILCRNILSTQCADSGNPALSAPYTSNNWQASDNFMEHYEAMRPLLRNSCISTPQEFESNFFIGYNFSLPDQKNVSSEPWNLAKLPKGFQLLNNSSINITFSMATPLLAVATNVYQSYANNLAFYYIYHTVREFVISPGGIAIEDSYSD